MNLSKRKSDYQKFFDCLEEMAQESGKDYYRVTICISAQDGKYVMAYTAYIRDYGAAYGDSIKGCLEAMAMRIMVVDNQIGRDIDNSIH